MTKVFISYARGDDGEPYDPPTSFVTRLYRDLTAAGFDVWFDRVSMPCRQLAFHQEIADAIRARDRLVLVVGPKAALSDYVRQEWRWALELDKPVIPILRQGDISHLPGELSLLHCDDFRDDAQYPAQFAKLIENLRRPAPPLGALYGVPNLPPYFLGRPELLRRVKDALLVDLQKPVVISGAASRVGMQGMGGIGKSVLAAAIARDPEVRRSYPDGIIWVAVGHQPDRVRLQRDVARHLGSQEPFQTEVQGQGVLRQLLAQKAVLLVLDDVWQAADAQAFDVLGPRCRALVTTRDAGILHTLGGQSVPVSLFTETEALQLLADAVGAKRSGSRGNSLSARFMQLFTDTVGMERVALPREAHEVVKECGCLPLAVALCGGMAKAGHSWQDIVGALRETDLEWAENREGANEQHRTIWNAMKASYDALPDNEKPRFAELAVFATERTVPEAAVHTLWKHTGQLTDRNCSKLLINLTERSLIQLDQKAAQPGEPVERRFRLHDLVYDFAKRLASEPKVLHQTLLGAYRTQCSDGWHTGPNDDYFLQNLVGHLIAAEQTDDLLELHLDLRWLEAKNIAGLTFDLPLDFARTMKVLSVGQKERHLLGFLNEAIRRDIHFIERHANDYPQALFQCLWNTCWWYDCLETANHYETGKVPGAEAQLGLSALLECWRKQKEQRMVGFVWVRSLRPPTLQLGTAQEAVFRTGRGYATSVCFSPDSTCLASGISSAICVWDIASGQELYRLEGHEGPVTAVSWLGDGFRIASGSDDGTVRIWDVTRKCSIAIFRGHSAGIGSIALSRDWSRLVSCSYDNTVRVWDVATGRPLKVFSVQTRDVWEKSTISPGCVALSPKGERIIFGTGSGSLCVLDAETGRELCRFRGSGCEVSGVAFSDDGKRIISASYDATLRIWDAITEREEAVWRGHEAKVTCMSCSADGDRIVSGSFDGTVRVWEALTGKELTVFKGHEFGITAVCYSPNGLWIASGSGDETIRLWNALGGERPVVIREHQGYVRSINFSPDGRRIVSGAYDKTVRIWDGESGVGVAVLDGHKDGVLDVRWSSDGKRILSRSQDKTQRIWDADNGQCLEVTAITDATPPEIDDQPQSPFRVQNCRQETVILMAATRQPIAWFPAELNPISTHLSGRRWAGASRKHVYIITIERTI